MKEQNFFPGRVLRDFKSFHQSMDLWVVPDDVEVERRRGLGDHRLTADVVRGLAPLPFGHAVPLAELASETIVVLDEISDLGAAMVSHDGVVRMAMPPVRLTGVTKVVVTWDEAQALTLLRTHAPRIAMASGVLARRILSELEESLGVFDSTQSNMMLRSPGQKWLRPSWQGWLIAEHAYERLQLTATRGQ